MIAAASLPSLPGREGWYERVKQSFIEGNSQERDDLLFFVKIKNYHVRERERERWNCVYTGVQ